MVAYPITKLPILYRPLHIYYSILHCTTVFHRVGPVLIHHVLNE